MHVAVNYVAGCPKTAHLEWREGEIMLTAANPSKLYDRRQQRWEVNRSQ